jgi:hypothetical protein
LFTPAGLAAFQTLRATYTKPTAATVRALTVLSNLAQSGSEAPDGAE